MSIEAIKAIKETEDRADQLRKESAQNAKQLISKANSKAAELVENATKSAETEAAKIIAEAQKQGDAQYEKIMEATADECKASKLKVKKNVPKAVEIILGRIVKPDGNS